MSIGMKIERCSGAHLHHGGLHLSSEGVVGGQVHHAHAIVLAWRQIDAELRCDPDKERFGHGDENSGAISCTQRQDTDNLSRTEQYSVSSRMLAGAMFEACRSADSRQQAVRKQSSRSEELVCVFAYCATGRR